MGCVSCGVELSTIANFCPKCGRKRESDPDDDAGATTHYRRAEEPQVAPSFDLKRFESELVRPQRRGRWIAAAALGVAGVTGLSLVLAANDDPPARALGAAQKREGGASQVAPAGPGSEAWAAPEGPRQDVEALGFAFPHLDHRDLGSLFDANLKPIYGAPALFEAHEPRRVRRNEMSHSLSSITDATQFDAGLRVLFAELGARWSVTREYRFYRAIQLAEVIRVDETRPMRKPPDAAMFYLAEVRTGATYDVLIEGARSSISENIVVELAEASGSLGTQKLREKYEVRHRGSGLRPKVPDAIFAATPQQVAQSYEIAEEPVPIGLVFRTIPGRTFKRKRLPSAREIANQHLVLGEGASQEFRMEKAGQYYVKVTSQPNGVVMSWSKPVACNPSIEGPERQLIETQCDVPKGAALYVTNWTRHGTGPTENAKAYIAKLPAAP